MPSTSLRARAHAPWSASKVQTALRCPREFHYRYVEKVPEPETMPETRIGKAAHAALELALQGTPIAEALQRGRDMLLTPLENAQFDKLEPGVGQFLDRVGGFRRQRRVQRQLIEFAVAVRQDMSETQFFAADALYRGVFDAAFLFDDGRVAVVDHKSGQRWPSMSAVDQLEGYAVLCAAYFRHVRVVHLGLHWVRHGEVDWAPPLTLAEVREEYVPRMIRNIEAAALSVDDGPRPIPSDWCLRCSYRSVCPAGQEALLEPVDEDELTEYEYFE